VAVLAIILGTTLGYLARHGPLVGPQDEHAARTADEARRVEEQRRRLDEERQRLEADRRRLRRDQAAARRRQEEEAGAAEARRLREQDRQARRQEEARARSQTEYARHMEAGKVALGAGNYTDAVREALAAQREVPEDPEAVLLQRQAEEGLAAEEDLDRRRAAHGRLVEQARDALALHHYDEAVQALTAALELLPDDRPTQKALRTARTARVEARLQYGNQMNQADAALRQGRFEDAHRLYTDASRTLPGDAAALRGRQLAEEAMRAAPGDREGTPVPRETAADPAAHDRAVRAGREAMRHRQYAEAARAFGSALRAWPDSGEARDGLRRARYGLAVAEGQRALRQRRIGDAIAAFEDALKEFPSDPAASAFLAQARALRR
jgi:tetratricopeptide (TPR) repeat protein